MKQLISVLIFSCLCSFSYAEEMKFVTVLSSPNGTFNRLETTDPNTAVSGLTVNFCTRIGRSGTVLLKGKKHVSLNQLTLNTATTLGRTDAGKFSLANVVINRSGSLTGGQLFGDDLAVKSSSTGSAVNVYSEDLVVSGAKTVGLTVGSASESQYSVMIGTGSTDKGMVWSNEYQQDEACKSGSSYENCTKQYLLKEKSEPASENIECTEQWDTPCGSAYDSNGAPSFYWKGTPLCSDVGGETGGTFEGKCVRISDCNIPASIKGKLDSTTIPSSQGQTPDECLHSSSHNDCGNYNTMYGDTWYNFIDSSKANSNCQAMCKEGSLREGRCSISGYPSQANRCIVYSTDPTNICTKYTLLCTVQEATKSTKAVMVECKKVS